jgi:histidinol-phosphate aminotransferase
VKTFDDIANPWIKGLATYEPGRPIEEVARELGLGNVDEIIKVASNENALGPSPRAVKAMRQAAAHMHRYPDGGAYYLKQALARKLGVEPTQLLPGTGSNELIELLAHVFLRPDTSVVTADRAFIVYRLVAASLRASVIEVPMADYTHDLGAMLAAIDDSTRIVFVANPNNPTSTMVGEAEIEPFLAEIPDHVVVCFDEAYVELLPPERRPDTVRYVREGRKVVLLRTFSKTYGLAGLRIGYAIAPEPCIRLLDRVRQPFNVNAMAQAAALAALDDDEHIERTRAMVQEGIVFLRNRFEALGLPCVPPVANFVLVDVGKIAGKLGEDPGGGGRAVFEALQRRGIIARPMDVYGLPGHLRFTVGTQEENERCVAALEALLS